MRAHIRWESTILQSGAQRTINVGKTNAPIERILHFLNIKCKKFQNICGLQEHTLPTFTLPTGLNTNSHISEHTKNLHIIWWQKKVHKLAFLRSTVHTKSENVFFPFETWILKQKRQKSESLFSSFLNSHSVKDELWTLRTFVLSLLLFYSLYWWQSKRMCPRQIIYSIMKPSELTWWNQEKGKSPKQFSVQ